MHKQAISVLFGNIIFALSQFGILSFLGHYGGPILVGYFSLGLAIATPIFMLTGLGLRTALATNQTEKISFYAYFQLRLLMAIIGLALIAVFLVYSQHAAYLTILFISLAKASELISDICYGKAQRDENSQLIGKSLAIRGTSGAVFFISAYILSNSIVLASIFFSLAWLASLTLDLKIVTNEELFPTIVSKNTLKKLTIISFPLGLTALVQSLNINIPRYFIDAIDGAEILGVYAAITFIILSGGLSINALGQTFLPRFSLYWQKNEKEKFLKLLSYGALLSCLQGALTYILIWNYGNEILEITFGDNFAGYKKDFELAALGGILFYISSFLGFVGNSTRLFWNFFPVYLLTLICHTITSALLIPNHGLSGSIWSFLITMTIFFLLVSASLTRQVFLHYYAKRRIDEAHL